MSVLKNLVITLAITTAGLAMFDASATELWEEHLAGTNEGSASGVLAPEGVYASIDVYTVNYRIYNNAGNPEGVNLGGQVVAPTILWSTGIKVLGGDYGVAIEKPVDYTNLTGNGIPSNGHWGTYNTVLIPAILAWRLPNDFYVRSTLSVLLNDASSSPAKPAPNHGVGSGNGYSSILPTFGVSWLHDGWNLSANMYYAFNQSDSATQYKSGQLFQADYTVAKNIGKWTAGIGAFQVNQTTADTGSGAIAAGCELKDGCRARRLGLGPLVSYKFDDGLSLRLIVNRTTHVSNDVGGNVVNVNLGIPFKF